MPLIFHRDGDYAYWVGPEDAPAPWAPEPRMRDVAAALHQALKVPRASFDVTELHRRRSERSQSLYAVRDRLRAVFRAVGTKSEPVERHLYPRVATFAQGDRVMLVYSPLADRVRIDAG